MPTFFNYPELYNRLSPSDWSDSGKPEALNEAVQRKEHILATHFPKHVSDEVDDKIRAEFPVFLSKKAMGR